MGWETRRGTGQYYTRSRKAGGRVVREYVGGGLVGELAARRDAIERQTRMMEAAAQRAARAHYEAAEAPLIELCEMTDLLVRATLVTAHYRQHHRGEWRRRRAQTDHPD